MSTKPQTFEEWANSMTKQQLENCGWPKNAYEAGQKSMEPAISLLAEIVTSYDAGLEANQIPWTRLDLIQAIDLARELLKGEK